MTRQLIVPPDAGAVRLDIFLGRTLPSVSRRRAQQAIAGGSVRLNGRRTRKGAMVRAGDVLTVPDDLFAPPTLQPNADLRIPILYEDADLIFVDKPAGTPSHALRAGEMTTVANFLLARFPELVAVGKGPLEPGIVHRLDTDTSGVLLAARHSDAYRLLREQFARHTVEKEYLALVEGQVRSSGRTDMPLAAAQHGGRRMRVARASAIDPAAQAAETSYQPVERFTSATLLAVQIRSGVRHQIRVHLASVGHPVVGDQLYGATATSRHLLHAARLAVRHPVTGRRVEVLSPLPADFAEYLENLRRS